MRSGEGRKTEQKKTSQAAKFLRQIKNTIKHTFSLPLVACRFSFLLHKASVEKADNNLILVGSQGLHALFSRRPQECFPFFGSHIILLECVLPLVVMNRCSEVMITADKPNSSSLDYSLWDYRIQYLFFSHTLAFLCDYTSAETAYPVVSVSHILLFMLFPSSFSSLPSHSFIFFMLSSIVFILFCVISALIFFAMFSPPQF